MRKYAGNYTRVECPHSEVFEGNKKRLEEMISCYTNKFPNHLSYIRMAQSILKEVKRRYDTMATTVLTDVLGQTEDFLLAVIQEDEFEIGKLPKYLKLADDIDRVSWKRLLLGSGLLLLGVAFAATSALMMTMSCGVSLPLSAISVALGLFLAKAGTALFTGTGVALALGGMTSSIAGGLSIRDGVELPLSRKMRFFAKNLERYRKRINQEAVNEVVKNSNIR